MAEQSCGASVQACAIRVAVLDRDGVPLPGAGNLYVTDALIKLDATPVYFKGQDVQQPNACGGLCVVYKSPDVLVRYDVTLSICTYDPELENILAGGETYSQSGFTIGASVPAVGVAGRPNGLSIELWSKYIVGGDVDVTWPYIRWALPRVRLQPDKTTWDNTPMSRDFTGYTAQNPNFFNGPANDWPFQSDRSLFSAKTKTLPAVVCGAQTLIGS